MMGGDGGNNVLASLKGSNVRIKGDSGCKDSVKLVLLFT